MNNPHASAASAKSRFDDERESNLASNLNRLGTIRYGFSRPWKCRDIHPVGQRPSSHFIAHHLQQVGARTNKSDSCPSASTGELRAFTQKTIARMDRFHTRVPRDAYDTVDVQISGDRTFSGPDLVRFIGFKTMNAEAILLSENGDSVQAQV
jgi:hypothetical protein